MRTLPGQPSHVHQGPLGMFQVVLSHMGTNGDLELNVSQANILHQWPKIAVPWVYDSAQYPMFCQIDRRKDTRLLSIALPRVPHVATPGEQKQVPTLTSEHLKSSNILPSYMSDLKTLKCMVGCCAMIILHILYIEF